MNGKSTAGARGQMFEKAVGALIEEKYQKVPAKNFLNLCNGNDPIYAAQCTIGKDIYNKNRRVDFILYHPEKWKNCLVIQCKWQSESGSVEQKYPFEVLSIELSGYDTIIVLDGGGYTNGAEEWLKRQVGENHLIHVMSLSEFCNFKGL